MLAYKPYMDPRGYKNITIVGYFVLTITVKIFDQRRSEERTSQARDSRCTFSKAL